MSNQVTIAERGASQIKRGAVLAVVAGCALNLLAFGGRSSLALYLTPVTEEFGWGRGTFALAIAIQNLLWGAGQPFAGAVADRFGSGRVIAAGGMAYAMGLLLMGQSSTPAGLYLSIGVIVGLGMSAASLSVVLAAVGRRVPEEGRARALGLVTAAGSIGQVFLVPLARVLLKNMHWSTVISWFALIGLVIVFMATRLTGRATDQPSLADQSLREALEEARSHRSYLLLVFGFLVCGFHVVFIGTHLPAYVEDLGLGKDLAAGALTVIGLFNVIGAFSAGILGDRVSKPKALSMLYLLRTVAIVVFISVPAGTVATYLFAASIGLLWLSTVPLTAGLVAQIFGPRYMGTLFGVVFFSHQIGSFLGAWFGGYIFDTTGSYTAAWWLAAVLGLIAAALHAPIDERPIDRGEAGPGPSAGQPAGASLGNLGRSNIDADTIGRLDR